MKVRNICIFYFILSLYFFTSCKKENNDPIYKSIPTKYDVYFEKIRVLKDTANLEVKSSSGLLDELVLTTSNEQKKYTELFNSYTVRGADNLKYYIEVYRQGFSPSIYNFYKFSYSIDFKGSNNYAPGPQDAENYFAIFKISNFEIFNIKLSTSEITSTYPYDVITDFTLNNILYPTVYKININTPNGLSNIRTVYFTFTHGVIRFETIANDVFDVSI